MTNAELAGSVLDRVFSRDETVFDENPGLADVKKNAALVRGFSDLSQTIVQQVSEGDRVATHSILRGTNDGALFGRPATGKRIEFQFLYVVRVENARIVAYNSAVDWLAVLTQLGLFAVVPQP